MKVIINRQDCDLPEPATAADAIAAVQAQAPFALAVNTEFVPKSRYAETRLNEGDRIEIISPVTGG